MRDYQNMPAAPLFGIASRRRPPTRDSWLAVGLSFHAMGLGHLYLKRFRLGMTLLALHIVSCGWWANEFVTDREDLLASSTLLMTFGSLAVMIGAACHSWRVARTPGSGITSASPALRALAWGALFPPVGYFLAGRIWTGSAWFATFVWYAIADLDLVLSRYYAGWTLEVFWVASVAHLYVCARRRAGEVQRTLVLNARTWVAIVCLGLFSMATTDVPDWWGMIRVETTSMLPGISPGEVIRYRRADVYERGAVVVARIDGSVRVRRIVALPGDQVVILGGRLEVNGMRRAGVPGEDDVAFPVPAGSYVVVADRAVQDGVNWSKVDEYRMLGAVVKE